MREVEGRKLAELILKGQGCLLQTSVAILNIDTDVTDKLEWRLCNASWFISACVWTFDSNHRTLSRRCDE